jgi:hypothetical protein
MAAQRPGAARASAGRNLRGDLQERSAGGERSSLPQEIRRTVQFPRRTAIRFEAPGAIFRRAARFPCRCGVQSGKYVARLRPVYANNLVELAGASPMGYYGSLTLDLDGPTENATNRWRRRKRRPARGAVDLRALAGASRAGLLVEIAREAGATGADRGDGSGIAARTFAGGALAG